MNKKKYKNKEEKLARIEKEFNNRLANNFNI